MTRCDWRAGAPFSCRTFLFTRLGCRQRLSSTARGAELGSPGFDLEPDPGCPYQGKRKFIYCCDPGLKNKKKSFPGPCKKEEIHLSRRGWWEILAPFSLLRYDWLHVMGCRPCMGFPKDSIGVGERGEGARSTYCGFFSFSRLLCSNFRVGQGVLLGFPHFGMGGWMMAVFGSSQHILNCTPLYLFRNI